MATLEELSERNRSRTGVLVTKWRVTENGVPPNGTRKSERFRTHARSKWREYQTIMYNGHGSRIYRIYQILTEGRSPRQLESETLELFTQPLHHSSRRRPTPYSLTWVVKSLSALHHKGNKGRMSHEWPQVIGSWVILDGANLEEQLYWETSGKVVWELCHESEPCNRLSFASSVS